MSAMAARRGIYDPVTELKTYYDVERFFLGFSPGAGESYEPGRTKATYTSGDGANVNALYSARAVINILYDETLQGAITKNRWISGVRYHTAAASVTPADAAVAEGANLVTAGKGTNLEQIYVPKVTSRTVDISDTYRLLGPIDNNVPADQLIDFGFMEFKDLRERQLHLDYNDITQTTNLDSLMRLLATENTTTNLGYTAGDEDYPIGGVDKSVQTALNAQDNVPAVAQNFSLDLIDQAVTDANPYMKRLPSGRAGAFVYTGESGYKKIKQHVGPEVWQERTTISFTVNGWQTEEGTDFKRAVSMYDQMPVIITDRMWTTGTTSDIALIHREAIELRVLMTPTVFQSDDVIKNGAFLGKTVFEAQDELFALTFPANAWIGNIA